MTWSWSWSWSGLLRTIALVAPLYSTLLLGRMSATASICRGFVESSHILSKWSVTDYIGSHVIEFCDSVGLIKSGTVLTASWNFFKRSVSHESSNKAVLEWAAMLSLLVGLIGGTGLLFGILAFVGVAALTGQPCAPKEIFAQPGIWFAIGAWAVERYNARSRGAAAAGASSGRSGTR